MRKFLLSFLPALCFLLQGFQAAEHIEPNRLLTVRDGLPQSFVSGMFQDDNGFLWVSTLNGLGRYDGRSFKNYVHLPSDTSGISSNIILYLFDAGNKELWLCYMDGRIDQFNTVTGNVVHLWKNKHFVRLKNESGNFKTLLRNNKGSAWMMAGDGGIFEIDLQKKTTVHLSPADLHLQEKVLGMAVRNEKLLLLTKTRLVSCNENTRVNTSIPYPFKSIGQASPGPSYSPGVRPNGDLLSQMLRELKYGTRISLFSNRFRFVAARRANQKLHSITGVIIFSRTILPSACCGPIILLRNGRRSIVL
jgi:hypothetical protein